MCHLSSNCFSNKEMVFVDGSRASISSAFFKFVYVFVIDGYVFGAVVFLFLFFPFPSSLFFFFFFFFGV